MFIETTLFDVYRDVKSCSEDYYTHCTHYYYYYNITRVYIIVVVLYYTRKWRNDIFVAYKSTDMYNLLYYYVDIILLCGLYVYAVHKTRPTDKQ